MNQNPSSPGTGSLINVDQIAYYLALGIGMEMASSLRGTLRTLVPTVLGSFILCGILYGLDAVNRGWEKDTSNWRNWRAVIAVFVKTLFAVIAIALGQLAFSAVLIVVTQSSNDMDQVFHPIILTVIIAVAMISVIARRIVVPSDALTQLRSLTTESDVAELQRRLAKVEDEMSRLRMRISTGEHKVGICVDSPRTRLVQIEKHATTGFHRPVFVRSCDDDGDSVRRAGGLRHRGGLVCAQAVADACSSGDGDRLALFHHGGLIEPGGDELCGAAGGRDIERVWGVAVSEPDWATQVMLFSSTCSPFRQQSTAVAPSCSRARSPPDSIPACDASWRRAQAR